MEANAQMQSRFQLDMSVRYLLFFPGFFLFSSLVYAQNTQTGVGKGGSTGGGSAVYLYKTASPDGSGKFYMGREIAQVMGFSGADWLERDVRKKEEKTDLAIQKLPLTSSSVLADIGAGTGYFTFKVAPRLSGGKIYAEDIQDELLSYLKNRKEQLHLKNVEVVKGSAYSVNLPKASVDLALLVDVYHEFSYPFEMLQSIKTALRPGGKVVLLEYRAEDPEVPIKTLHKMSVVQANREFAAQGFKLIEDGEFLPWQHFLVYQK